MVTDLLPAPPLPEVDAGVDVELEELPPALLLGVELELLLLLPQAVAMITVATSIASPTNPPRAPLVMSLLL
ncbi:MAG: hypothetical protein ACXVSJ_02605 [Solirubrobacteraceae bacterium]